MIHPIVRPLTADEFFSLDLYDVRSELVQGEVVRMCPAGGEHGVVAMRIGARLLAFVEAHGGQPMTVVGVMPGLAAGGPE